MLSRATRERLEEEVRLAANAAGEEIRLLVSANVQLPGVFGWDGLVAISPRWVVLVWEEQLGHIEQRAWTREDLEQPGFQDSFLGPCFSFRVPEGRVQLERFESREDLLALCKELGVAADGALAVAPGAEVQPEHAATPRDALPTSSDVVESAEEPEELDLPPPEDPEEPDEGQDTPAPSPVVQPAYPEPAHQEPAPHDPRAQAQRFLQQVHAGNEDEPRPVHSIQELTAPPPSWTTPRVGVLAAIGLGVIFFTILILPERRQRFIKLFYDPAPQVDVELEPPIPRGLMGLDFGMTLEMAKEALPLMRAELYQVPDAPSDGFVLPPPFLRGPLSSGLAAPDISGTRWGIDATLAGEPASCSMHFDGGERLSRVTCRVREQEGLDRHQVVEEALLRGLKHNHGQPTGQEGVRYTADALLDAPYRVSYLWIDESAVLHLYSAYGEWRGASRSELVLDNFIRQ